MQNINYQLPINVAEDIYWVGYSDASRGITDNPYLIKDGEEGILIDGGSRPDFPTVMMKIMQTGLAPANISTLIYQHYDPDLCGSITNLEQIIDNPDLKIISEQSNNLFIEHYGVKTELKCMDKLGGELELKSGRVLKFYKTPYCHAPGSFITHDLKTNTLFSSDLLGSFCKSNEKFELFRPVADFCLQCTSLDRVGEDYICPDQGLMCPAAALLGFQKELMTSNRALRYALQVIKSINASIIAPQHGFIIQGQKDFDFFYKILIRANDIGIDGVLKDGHE